MKKYTNNNTKLALAATVLVAVLAVGGLIALRPQGTAKQIAPEQAAMQPRQLAPPTISWIEAPRANERGRLSMSFKIEASTPLRNLQVQITPIVKLPELKVERDVRDIPTWLLGQRTINWEGEMDLTASPLAGNPVILEIIASDEDKRTSVSDVASITLPERIFTSPVAKSLYSLRKTLRQDPEKRNDALRLLASVLQQRENFEGRGLTLLTLRSAAVRIALDPSEDGLNSALDLLWHAAILFEQNQVRVADKLVPTQKN
jgi:hypothetical protein